MSFAVLYDACVLHPAPLRDLLLRIACSGVVRARWSEEILDECFRSILARRPDLSEAQLARTRELMNRVVPDCLVTGYEPLIAGLTLPDANDRHVLAAAIRASVQTIVTFNLSDFPVQALQPFCIEAKHPDEFVIEVLHLSPTEICDAVLAQVNALKKPPVSLIELLRTLRSQGLPNSVSRLHELLAARQPPPRTE